MRTKQYKAFCSSLKSPVLLNTKDDIGVYMPGFTTHYLLGMKAYNSLEYSKLKSIISKYRWLYQLGLQGPDMFFYNIPILRHRDYRNVGSYMHEEHVNAFFANALDEISHMHSRQKSEQALSFISGFISHYIGDYICHPYVYGRIGYDPEAPTKYMHGMHAALENDLDAILLKKYKNKKPSEFSQASTICLNGFEMQFVSAFLAKIINITYYPITYENSFQVTPSMVHRSILAMRFGCRTLADPKGKKKMKIGIIENIFLKSPVVSHRIVGDKLWNRQKSLNLNHETWCNPWDKRLASQQSFPELFHLSLKKCHDAFYLLNEEIKRSQGLYKSDFHRLLKELGDYSYHSGLSPEHR